MASKLYIHNNFNIADPGMDGVDDLNLMDTSQGNGSVSVYNSPTLTGTVTPPTAATLVTYAIGGDKQTWLSNPLNAVTISGTVTFNIWAKERNATDNATITAELCRADSSGNPLSVIAAVLLNRAELSTTESAQNWSVTPTTTTINQYEKLLLRFYIDDGNGVTMASGGYVDFSMDGNTTGASGDTYVQLTETITESNTLQINTVDFSSVDDDVFGAVGGIYKVNLELDDTEVANTGTTYSTVRSASTGSFAFGSTGDNTVESQFDGTTYQINRYFARFKSFWLHGWGITKMDLHLHGSFQGGTPVLYVVTHTATPFGGQFDTTDFGLISFSQGSSSFSLTNGVDATIALNSTAKTWINGDSTGNFTNIAIVEQDDLNNTTPPNAAKNSAHSAADNSTPANAPYVQIILAPQPVVSDSSAVTESTTVRLSENINVSDSSTVTDVPTVRETDNISVFDSSTVTNVITAINAPTVRPVNKFDSSAVTESTTMLVKDNVNVSDSSTVTEAVTMLQKDNINTFDSSTVTDAAIVGIVSPYSVSTLTEDWQTGAIDNTKWTSTGNASAATNQLVISSQPATTNYYDVYSVKQYNLLNNSVYVQLVNAGSQAVGLDVVFYVSLTVGNLYKYYFDITNNTLQVYKFINSVSTQLTSTAYDSTNHKWLRIREQNTVIYFDTSADGITWSNLTSATAEFAVSSVYVGQQVGTWQSIAQTSATFDNLNTNSFTVTVNDSSTATESTTMLLKDNISVNDSSSVTESTALVMTDFVNVSDSSTVTEQIQARLTEEELLYDATTVTELVQMSITSSIVVNEASSASESLTVGTDNNVSSSDSVGVLESASVTTTIAVAVNDSSTVSESVSVAPSTPGLVLSDSSTVTDTVTVSQTYTLTVSDSSTVTDVLIKEQEDLDITIAESINVTDTLNGQNNGIFFNPLDMNLYEQIGGAYKFIILDGRIAMQLAGNQYTVL